MTGQAGMREDGRDFAYRPGPRPSPTPRVRSLRARMTWSEKRLWRELKKLDLNFRRQAPIGPYFADFACHGRNLVIEVDGRVHELFPEVVARDTARQRWLESQGYTVLRFNDRQVLDDVHAVMETIALLLDGGGSGGGGPSEAPQTAGVGADAERRLSPRRPVSTTIPGPSSIEEEGSSIIDDAYSDEASR